MSNAATCDFLEDGYTEQGYIAAIDGIHGPLEFEYRPAVGKLADRITGMIQGERANWEGWWDATSKALAVDPGLLKSWSLVNGKGDAVPITAANIQRVKQLPIHRLWMIVAGQLPSDTRPDGVQPGKVNLDNDTKN